MGGENRDRKWKYINIKLYCDNMYFFCVIVFRYSIVNIMVKGLGFRIRIVFGY